MRLFARRAVFLFLLAIPGCVGLGYPEPASEVLAREQVTQDLDLTREFMRPLRIDAPIETPSWESAVWRYYGLDSSVPHRFGSVIAPFGPDGTTRIAAHRFETPQPRGTIFFVHGYYDHVGIHARTIEEWVEAGYAVAAFDLPGHGLSEGERSAIDDFADYASAWNSVIAHCEDLPRPWFAVGHSTGCAVILERWMTSGVDPFERTVFIGPLVRSAYWGISKFGSSVVGVFTDSVKRTPRRDSSDEQFLRFRSELDPLQFDGFPLDWFDALRAWYARFEENPEIEANLLVYQGDLDDTVSWKHNMKKLREKVPDVKIVIIEGGRHQLLGEIPEYRQPVVEGILEFFGG